MKFSHVSDCAIQPGQLRAVSAVAGQMTDCLECDLAHLRQSDSVPLRFQEQSSMRKAGCTITGIVITRRRRPGLTRLTLLGWLVG